MTTSPGAAPAPTIQVQVGAGLNAADVDRILDLLGEVCAPFPVDLLRLRMSRTSHPAMPAAVLIDVEASVGTWTARVRAVDENPMACARRAAGRLDACLNRNGSAQRH